MPSFEPSLEPPDLSFLLVPLPTVTLFGHSYCHLCAQMQRALEALAQRLGFELELVDIEGRPELEARFGDRVPVVVLAGEEVCHHVLDEDELHASLARERNAVR